MKEVLLTIVLIMSNPALATEPGQTGNGGSGSGRPADELNDNDKAIGASELDMRGGSGIGPGN